MAPLLDSTMIDASTQTDNAGKQSQHNVQEILNMNEKGFSFTSMWPKVWTSGIISIAFDFANSCIESTSSGLQSAHTYITCLYLHTVLFLSIMEKHRELQHVYFQKCTCKQDVL